MLENVLLFLQALLVNLRIGSLTLAVGMGVGLIMAVIRHRGDGFARRGVEWLINFLRAFPVYVLLFVAANMLASIDMFDGVSPEGLAKFALVIALSAYTISACSDACLTFLRHRSRNEIEQAWLVIPNVVHIFVVTVVSTSLGAAIGVQEAVMFTIDLAAALIGRGNH